MTMDQLARREAKIRGLLDDLTSDEIQDWVEDMTSTLDEFEIGDVVIYLDGVYWRVDEFSIEFDGYFASHAFEQLPHRLALNDSGALDRILGDRNYWIDRELPNRDV